MSGDITPYLNLLTSEHQDKPRLTAFMTMLLQGLADLQANLLTLPALFDTDVAAASFLDQVGQWVGVVRNLPITLTGVYFSLDSNTLGLDQGSMQGPGDASGGIITLSDDAFRILIRGAIAANQWDGTIPGAYAAADILFNHSASTNYIFRSNQFAPYGPGSIYFDWALFNCTITANSVISPDGTVNAWLWQRSNTTAYTGKLSGPIDLTYYSFSLFASQGSGRYLALLLQTSGFQRLDAVFDLQTGLLFASSITNPIPIAWANVVFAITPQAHGFYRCSISGQLIANPNADTETQIFFSGNQNGVFADGTDSASNTTIQVYGAQFEKALSSAPTAYVNDIRIHDKNNMHMDYELTGPAPDSVILTLFQNGFLNLRPAGVQIDAYITPDTSIPVISVAAETNVHFRGQFNVPRHRLLSALRWNIAA